MLLYTNFMDPPIGFTMYSARDKIFWPMLKTGIRLYPHLRLYLHFTPPFLCRNPTRRELSSTYASTKRTSLSPYISHIPPYTATSTRRNRSSTCASKMDDLFLCRNRKCHCLYILWIVFQILLLTKPPKMGSQLHQYLPIQQQI